LAEDVGSHRKCLGGCVTFCADAGHGQGQGQRHAPPHLCHGTEEQC
jgi:hypothetical protein